jgi:Domain of unknown function (DUF6766)/ATP dependent DNA ligase C terminal region
MQYLTTGAFGEAVFENWESEFLQMGLYVVLTAFLFQRGSSESKDGSPLGKSALALIQSLCGASFLGSKNLLRESCPFVNLALPRGSKRGQGITASEMRLCHRVEPLMVCQVKFAEWTRDERLRQPVFLGLREDKEATEVVREKVS